MRDLEVQVMDLKDQRAQLRAEVSRLNKALDRLRWPAGTTPPGGAGPSDVDRSSLFAYPRAAHANTESDFNIFTGEPNRGGKTVNLRRNQDTPATRMAWATQQTNSPSFEQHGPKTSSQGPLPNQSAASMSGTSVASGTKQTNTHTEMDETIARVLEDRMVDMARERKELENDMSKGVYGAEALKAANERVEVLDKQIVDILNALRA